MRKPAFTLAALALFGCAELPVEGELLVPGESAQIIRRMDNGEAGITWTITIDSASATWQSSCTNAIPQVTCPPSWRSGGSASPGQVAGLFRQANSGEFRALRAEYDLSATHVDAPLFTLTVTANARRRSIRWAVPPPVPATLQAFDDQVLMTANIPAPDRLGR